MVETEPTGSTPGKAVTRVEQMFRSAVGKVAGPVVMASSAALSSQLVRLETVIAGGVIAMASDLAVKRHIRRLEKEWTYPEDDVRGRLTISVRVLENLNPEQGGIFRASVLVVDSGRQVLRQGGMSTNQYKDDELAVEWVKGQGPPGLAWQSGRLVVAPGPQQIVPRVRRAICVPLPGSRRRGVVRYGTNEPNAIQPVVAAQLKLLDNVEMMICNPLICPRNGVIGVLTLEDTLPPGEHLEEVLTFVEVVSRDILPVLAMRRSG